jgi:hypothetical protein
VTYLEGLDLHEELSAMGRLPIEMAVDYVCQAAHGIHEAHELVHRSSRLETGKSFSERASWHRSAAGSCPRFWRFDFDERRRALAIDQYGLLNDVRRAVREDIDVENADHMHSAQAGHGARLAIEPSDDLAVVPVARVQELDGDRLAEPKVLRLKHDAHPAFADHPPEHVLSSDEIAEAR